MKPPRANAAARRPKGRYLGVDDQLARAIAASPLSHRRLAAKAGVDHRSVGRFVAGERSIDSGTFRELAHALGLVLADGRRAKPAAGPSASPENEESPRTGAYRETDGADGPATADRE